MHLPRPTAYGEHVEIEQLVVIDPCNKQRQRILRCDFSVNGSQAIAGQLLSTEDCLQSHL